METLVNTVTQKKTSSELKMASFLLVNKYYSKYPENVLSETETDDKFNLFVSMYLNKLSAFIKLTRNGFQCQETNQY